MKNNYLILLAALLLLSGGFAACESNGTRGEDPREGTDVPFTEYTLKAGSRWVNLEYDESGKGEILVINSDEELQKYVESDYPAIDFSKRTLVLAYLGPQKEYLFYSDKQYFLQISEKNYIMTVNTPPFAGSVEGGWQVAIVVDKLPSDVEIKLNVTTNTKDV